MPFGLFFAKRGPFSLRNGPFRESPGLIFRWVEPNKARTKEKSAGKSVRLIFRPRIFRAEPVRPAARQTAPRSPRFAPQSSTFAPARLPGDPNARAPRCGPIVAPATLGAPPAPIVEWRYFSDFSRGIGRGRCRPPVRRSAGPPVRRSAGPPVRRSARRHNTLSRAPPVRYATRMPTRPPHRRRPSDTIPEPRGAARLNSRAKGATAERELAELLRAVGWPGAIRGQQRAGVESSDIVGGPTSLHIECKAVESPAMIHDAIRQAERDAQAQARDGSSPRLPVVAWKRRRAGWVACVDLGAFLTLVREAETANGARVDATRAPLAADPLAPYTRELDAALRPTTAPLADVLRTSTDPAAFVTSVRPSVDPAGDPLATFLASLD